MISNSELKKSHPDIWMSFRNLLGGGSGIPCLFATGAFAKKVMKFIVVDKRNEIVNRLSNDLVTFSEDLRKSNDHIQKTYATLVVVCRELFDYSLDENDFIENLLIDLRLKDPMDWPEGKTKNPNDQDFEFYYNGVSWFPILLHKTHRERIRYSDFLILAFQPGYVFEFNKNHRKDFYERMRVAIHNRIKCAYPEGVPFYLSRESEGKNICQYSGIDKSEYLYGYEYSILK